MTSSLTATHKDFQEGVDGTSIKEISNLTYTWKSKMKEWKGV